MTDQTNATTEDAKELKKKLMKRSKELDQKGREDDAQKLKSAAMLIAGAGATNSSGIPAQLSADRPVGEETRKEMADARDLLEDLS